MREYINLLRLTVGLLCLAAGFFTFSVVERLDKPRSLQIDNRLSSSITFAVDGDEALVVPAGGERKAPVQGDPSTVEVTAAGLTFLMDTSHGGTVEDMEVTISTGVSER